jgi:hypothetical protein
MTVQKLDPLALAFVTLMILMTGLQSSAQATDLGFSNDEWPFNTIDNLRSPGATLLQSDGRIMDVIGIDPPKVSRHYEAEGRTSLVGHFGYSDAMVEDGVFYSPAGVVDFLEGILKPELDPHWAPWQNLHGPALGVK